MFSLARPSSLSATPCREGAKARGEEEENKILRMLLSYFGSLSNDFFSSSLILISAPLPTSRDLNIVAIGGTNALSARGILPHPAAKQKKNIK
jgi:hypothetical protein